ncbi:hypothetical protein WJX72_005067 [[Myrmecia] bisecta]|uniref:Uncharacterized protein n=1 Tax=[Myrmecia] bisecta TaxID=41462 RepID=A0AAW1QQI1_9CHLO
MLLCTYQEATAVVQAPTLEFLLRRSRIRLGNTFRLVRDCFFIVRLTGEAALLLVPRSTAGGDLQDFAAGLTEYSLGYALMVATLLCNGVMMFAENFMRQQYLQYRTTACIGSHILHKLVQMALTLAPYGTLCHPRYNTTVALLESAGIAQIWIMSYGLRLPAKRQRLMGGTVWFVLSVGLLYIICDALLVLLDSSLNEAAAQALFRQVPAELYRWSALSFLTAFLLNLRSLWDERPNKRNLAVLCCFISAIAGLADHRLVTNPRGIWFDSNNNPLQARRYLHFAATTPAIVFLISRVSDLPPRRIWGTCTLQVFVIASGFGASLVDGAWKWTWFCAGSFLTIMSSSDDEELLMDLGAGFASRHPLRKPMSRSPDHTIAVAAPSRMQEPRPTVRPTPNLAKVDAVVDLTSDGEEEHVSLAGTAGASQQPAADHTIGPHLSAVGHSQRAATNFVLEMRTAAAPALPRRQSGQVKRLYDDDDDEAPGQHLGASSHCQPVSAAAHPAYEKKADDGDCDSEEEAPHPRRRKTAPSGDKEADKERKRAEKEAARREKAERLALEKEAKARQRAVDKAEKERQKEQLKQFKKQQKEELQRAKGNFSMKETQVIFDKEVLLKLKWAYEASQQLREKDMGVAIMDLPLSGRGVVFRRQVPALPAAASDSQVADSASALPGSLVWQDLPYVLLCFTAADFTAQVEKDRLQSVFDAAGAAYPEFSVGLLIEGLEHYLTQRGRQDFRRDGPGAAASFDRRTVDNFLMDIAVRRPGVHFRLAVDGPQCAEHLVGLARALADQPYKVQESYLACFGGGGRDSASIKALEIQYPIELPDRAVWFKALTYMQGLPPGAAHVIANTYTSLGALASVYMDDSKSERTKAMLLEDLTKPGEGARSRVGPAASKKLYRFLTATDPLTGLDELGA